MGLDMYLHSVDHDPRNKNADQDIRELKPKDIGYWRKANHIHGYMEDLYYKLGGSSSSFNTNTVKLSILDIVDLCRRIIDNDLSVTEGFFFGGDNRPEETDTESLIILLNAIKEIEMGKDVYYSSWW